MGTDKRDRQKQGHLSRLEEARRAERRDRTVRGVVGIILALGVLVGFAFVVNLVQDDDEAEIATDTSLDNESTTTSVAPEPTACTEEPGATLEFAAPFENKVVAGATYTARFDTSEGEIVVALDTERTPATSNNFIELARAGYYHCTLMFRTDTSIDIIQGGSPHTQDNSDPGPGYNIEDEGGEFAEDGSTGPFTYEPGQLVMARSQGPDSASAQYFFTVGPNAANLDAQGTYVVFGTVTEGLDALEAILALDAGGFPSREVMVNKVTINQT